MKLNQFTLVNLAHQKLGNTLVPQEYLKELEELVDALLERNSMNKASAENTDSLLSVGRHWICLLGILTAASTIFSFIDNADPAMTEDDKKNISRVAHKFKKFVKTSDIGLFLVSRPIRFLMKGLKHIYDKDAPTTSVKCWQRGLISGAPSELVIGVLNARIAKHTHKDTKKRYLMEAQRFLKQIGSQTELEVIKSI
jgi:hypothetical protein